MINEYAKALTVIGVAVTIAFAGAAGYEHGYHVAKTRGDLALAQEREAQQKAAADAERIADDRYAAEVDRGNQAAQALIVARQQIDHLTSTAKGKIDAVTQTYRPTLSANLEPLPRCVFTRGFVRVWNSVATDAGADPLPDRAVAGGADAETGADDALDSGVSQADILDWLTDYAARNRRIDAQLNKVLDIEAERQKTQQSTQ
ncbi:putative phage protein Rz [Burkholderia sp. MSHR3999]|uniref:hypothetical protein n=1 Tax=Burkholderia sp. MSHR3999 TaxID=1542965 RepID=UPI0005AC07EA|nr:hypothetical protein [Burkholderia sp. MSHR3999]KIP19603.1 putative phage protein Rz [Burkholderia sp. MSHR3999]